MRLKDVLGDIIDEAQSAFIEGRQIVHNVMLVQELMNQYKRKNITPRCVMKINLRKAYNWVAWPFVGEMPNALNFPTQFISWIMTCITNTRYSLSINSGIFGHFRGKKGLRQGDPLSPFIFVICMEYLSRILRYVRGHHSFSYHSRYEHLNLTHLSFADDLMLFCKGDSSSVCLMMRGIESFSLTSGLVTNKEKSTVYFGNVKDYVKGQIMQVSGFYEGKLPFRYLGISISTKRISTAECEILVDKISA